MNKKKTLRLDF